MQALLFLVLRKLAKNLAIGFASYLAAHAGLTDSFGLQLSVNPDTLALGLLASGSAAVAGLKSKLPDTGPFAKLKGML